MPSSSLSKKSRKPSAAAPDAWEAVKLAAGLADRRDDHYRLLLAVDALVDLLVAKGLIAREELQARAARLDSAELPAVSADALRRALSATADGR